MMQAMRGTEALDDIFWQLLDRVNERIHKEPLPVNVKKHILCVYLSALVYNNDASLSYFEQRQMTGQLV